MSDECDHPVYLRLFPDSIPFCLKCGEDDEKEIEARRKSKELAEQIARDDDQ